MRESESALTKTSKTNIFTAWFYHPNYLLIPKGQLDFNGTAKRQRTRPPYKQHSFIHK